MENSNFDLLLKRYLADEVSEEEKNKIEAWLEVMKTENTTDLELSKEQEEKLFQKIISKKNNLKEVQTLNKELIRSKRSGSGWIRVAASILLLLSLTFVIWTSLLKGQFFPSVEKVILNDGSLVWLKGESKLAYYNKGDFRYAELNGEALFEVAKDADHPFVVQCGEVTLKVLGTSFSVKTDVDKLELNVLTGKVNISSPSDTEGIDVVPNEKVSYVNGGRVEKKPLLKEEVLKITDRTEYLMDFRSVPLKEVVQSLGKKFDIKIKLGNKDMEECSITANLTDHSLESSILILNEILNIKESRDGNEITLLGTGCK